MACYFCPGRGGVNEGKKMEMLSNPVRIAALAAVISMGGSAASAATTFD